MDDIVELAKLALEAVKSGHTAAFLVSLVVTAAVVVVARRLLKGKR